MRMNKILDMLHLSLFYYTMRASSRIHYENDYYDNLCILYKLIKRVHKSIPIEGLYSIEADLDRLARDCTWDSIINQLSYYSDRWNRNRLNMIILMYNELNDSRYIFRSPRYIHED